MAHLQTSKLPYRSINVKVANDSYTFTSPSSSDAPALIIDRPTGDVRLSEGSVASAKRTTRVSSIVGILGIIQLRLDKYVIFITKAQPMGCLKGHMVYKVAATEILPMRQRLVHDPDEDVFIELLKTFLASESMYFSYSIDLTNSFQRQSQADTSKPLWMRADGRFFFNKYLQSDLIAFRTRGAQSQPGAQPGIDPYILPCIFGMLEIKPTTFKNKPLTLVLISRRSRHRGGTRYFTRGVDDDGHVANYNETEQILITNNSNSGLSGYTGSSGMQSSKFGAGTGQEMQIFSYVQTRGSVPTFWAEINSLRYVPKLQIRGVETAFTAAQKHFDEQIRLYGDNYLINLVNQKGRERRMKDSYEKMVEMLISSPKERQEADLLTEAKFTTIQPNTMRQEFDRLHYVYFDYHSETKGMRMDKAYALLDKLAEALNKQGYFLAVDTPASVDGNLDARCYQTSVMRTNCMDCLDRTNVVQSMFARHRLDRILEDLGFMPRGSSFRDEDEAFEDIFRNLWADNADAISSAYSGTGAMKTDVTRTGKPTMVGALQDTRIRIARYFCNNFFDGPRQDSFDLFLGAYQAGTTNTGTTPVFTDRRPILIQAIPYILAFSSFIILVGLFIRRAPDASVLPMRIFLLFWTVIAIWAFIFVWNHGMLYVNWPRLNPRSFAVEGYKEHYVKARKDSLIGPYVAKHGRGLSTTPYLNAEEGKKRIE
ncbi:SacI homology domain-containing protein [Dactylonectria estremocensis]|uniref:SacI homology domain-containing protein n=1 Tax=Dactylonectria estremocensis TaxID=1079267 RepID=A0A9P9EYT8_9HYPO|nr:SacI homology domain-containing protein [Dactylonectria estremocensis]